tara:strand:+ start:2052 stop:2180 length:129 start_codon:yes stop_codon:yes gene_type:complete
VAGFDRVLERLSLQKKNPYERLSLIRVKFDQRQKGLLQAKSL